MSRPTFPARNQWSGDANASSDRLPGAAHKRQQALAAGAAQTPSLPQPAVAAHAPPAPKRHIMPVNSATTVGGAGHANTAALRARMVQQLQAQGLHDARVIAALLAVERHCFVDSALLTQAYLDTSLPIGLQQTISKPGVVARMVELLLSSPFMQQQPPTARLGRVLEIGTGCAYQASVLSHVADEVYSVERLKGLHDKARDNLRPFRIPNIHLLLGDGMLGYASGAPYAGIIAAAGGHAIPQAWIDQLAVGGRIVAPMSAGAPGQQSQVLVVLDKTAHGLQHTVLEPVLFVPLKSGVG